MIDPIPSTRAERQNRVNDPFTAFGRIAPTRGD